MSDFKFNKGVHFCVIFVVQGEFRQPGIIIKNSLFAGFERLQKTNKRVVKARVIAHRLKEILVSELEL